VGGAVGGLERLLFPSLTGDVGAYALVGMGAVFAGILRAPMTSIFMILEVSGNYSIILPVMISNTIAYFISRRFQPMPIFDVLSHQDGMDLPSLEEQREVTTQRVEDAMRSPAGLELKAELNVADGLKSVAQIPDAFFVVYTPEGVWHGVAHDTLHRALAEGRGGEGPQPAGCGAAPSRSSRPLSRCRLATNR
jgi:CIC family chloride channel protein